MPRRLLSVVAVLGLATVALTEQPARAQPRVPFDRRFEISPTAPVLLPDLVSIQELGRALIALDSYGGTTPAIDLLLGERLLGQATQGAVGVVLTDRRLLLVSTRSTSWQEVRYRPGETRAADVEVGDRVVVGRTNRRILGFEAQTGNAVQSPLVAGERFVHLAAAETAAVVVTDRRALGLSGTAGGFFPFAFRAREQVESVEASADVAVVRTGSRLLIFRAPTGRWEDRPIPLTR